MLLSDALMSRFLTSLRDIGAVSAEYMAREGVIAQSYPMQVQQGPQAHAVSSVGLQQAQGLLGLREHLFPYPI